MDEMFVAPGPGEWNLDRSHYPGGTTPISAWLLEESMGAGTERVLAEIGAPVRRIDTRFVRGFMYTRVRPLIGGDKPPRRLPPRVILKLVTHLHPEFRRRARSAAESLTGEPSLSVAKAWESTMRPDLAARNVAFQAVDLEHLDDEALQRHISALLDHARETFELHFWLHGHDIGPVARLIHATDVWGIEPRRAVGMLEGASPTTTLPAARLRRLRLMVEEHGGVTTLDEVRAISTDAAALLDEHLAQCSAVLATGYDLTAFTLGELPNVVLNTIRSASEPTVHDDSALASVIRDEVPADDRADFDRYLYNARGVMNMRDDNGPLTVEWPIGLLRRALLVAGSRLANRGAIDDGEHVLELTHGEARHIFSGQLPDADTLRRRNAERISDSELDPPLMLGDPEPKPPIDILPSPLPDLVAIVETSLKHLGMDASSSGDRLSGVGVGAASYRGRARIARSADEAIERLEPGDVLVVRATSPAFNMVLTMAGAVVTANGGALSHAAVLARELGIPAVVGAAGALEIADGAMIEVDPVAGSVSVIDSY